MNIFNQFSYPIIIAVIVAGAFWLMYRVMHIRLRYVLLAQGGMAVVALVVFWLLRPPSDALSTAADAFRIIQNGKPTFLEFFSNYCTACLAVEPIVQGIIPSIEDDFNILRIDIHSSVGRDLRRRMVFSFTPEFILFNVNGEEIWRDHLPPSPTEIALAAQP